MMHRFRLIFERNSDLWLLAPGEEAHLLIRRARSAAISPDGKQVAYVHDRAIWICPIHAPQTARPICSLPGDTVSRDDSPVYAPVLSWHPRHPQIAYSVFCSYALLPKSDAGSPVDADSPNTFIDLSSIYTVDAPSSPSGKRQSGEYRWLTPWSRGLQQKGVLSASHPAWSPDGKYLALARGGALSLARILSVNSQPDRYPYEWDEVPVEGALIEGGADSSDVMGCNSISWRPDGRVIVTGIRRWNGGSYTWVEWHHVKNGVSMGKESILQQTNLPEYPRFTPDGHSLVFVQRISGDPCAFLHDLTTGRDHILVRSACNPQPFASPR